MNRDHIKAMLKGYFQWSTLGDVTLVTNGHFACVKPEGIECGSKGFPELSELWAVHVAKFALLPITPLGSLSRSANGLICREVGPALLNEAYVRCFDGPDVHWCAVDAKKAVLVHDGKNLLAVIMPVKRGNEVPITKTPSDEEVFGELANEGNGWYLVGRKRLDKERRRISEELRTAKDKRDELYDEIEALELEMSSIERRLEAKEAAR